MISNQLIDHYLKLGFKSLFIFFYPIFFLSKLLYSLIKGKEIAIYIGFIGKKNLGDELVYEAYKKMFPKMSFFNGNLDTPLYFILKYLSKCNIKAVLALGGGTLIYQSEHYLYQIKKYEGIVKYKFCIGTGVSDSKYWKKQQGSSYIEEWASVLNSFHQIGVRGMQSCNRLQKIEKKKYVAVTGDAAIFLADDLYDKKKMTKTLGINIVNKKRSDVDYHKLTGALDEIIEKLMGEKWRILFVPFNPKDEANMLDYISRSPFSKDLLIVNDYLNISNIFRVIATCDVFFGVRLHAGVAAACVRTPFVLMKYQEKHLDFMESLSLTDFCLGNEEIDPENIYAIIKELYEHIPRYQAHIDFYVRMYKKRQQEIIKKINSDLGKAI